MRTDFWHGSRSRGLWTSLFGARATKSAAKTRRNLHRGASQAQFESLETRRVLATDFSISSVSPTPVAENSGTGIVFNFNRAGSASAAVVTFHASGSANFAVGNPNPGANLSGLHGDVGRHRRRHV